jgi:hypothetical protein
MLTGSVGDLFEAPVTVSTKPRAGVAGTTYLGHRVEERNIVLNLLTFDDDPQQWAVTDGQLRRALAYDRDAVLRVETPESGQRWIKVRLAEAPKLNSDVDPHSQAAAEWEITLLALDPWWRGHTITDEVVFDGVHFRPTVTITNPGDVEAWPRWTLTSPAKWALPNPDIAAGELDDLTWLPHQPLGRDVVVDTDPLNQTIWSSDNGGDWGDGLWAQLNGAFFRKPVPPRTRPTTLPVRIDPLPELEWALPNSLREWVTTRIEARAAAEGANWFMTRTPEQLAAEIRTALQAATGPIIDWLSFNVLDNLVAPYIAQAITDAWGTVGALAGATAQISVETKWLRPWGGE